MVKASNGCKKLRVFLAERFTNIIRIRKASKEDVIACYYVQAHQFQKIHSPCQSQSVPKTMHQSKCGAGQT